MVADAADPVHVAGRRADIQGLRAVAVLLVVVYHSGVGLPGGFVGVDVFFVISGFVITRMLLTELKEQNRIDLKRFYLRRMRRILPALALLLVVTLILSVILAPVGGQQVTARTGAAAALFSANIYLIRFGGGGYFDVEAEVNALLHTWSLSVEEQFYFIFPAFLFGVWALGRRRRRSSGHDALALALIIMVIGSFAMSWALSNGKTGPLPISGRADEFAFFSSLTRAWEFAAGGLAALAASRVVTRTSTRLASGMALAGFVLIAWAAISFDEFTTFPGTAALYPVIGASLLILAGEFARSNPISGVLSTRHMQWLGDISYSWYLWHWPLIVFAAALWPTTPTMKVVAALISLAPAWASYRYVENPIRFKPRVPTIATLRLAAVCVVVPLIAAATLAGGHRLIAQTDVMVELDEAFEVHADVQRGCSNGTPVSERGESDCTWVVENPTGTAFLIGDSNAGQFTEGFTLAANGAGLDATVVTMPLCPMVDLILVGNGKTDDSCRRFVVDAIDYLATSDHEFLVIASSSDGYIESEEFELVDPSTGEIYSTPNEKARAWVLGLSRVLQTVGVADRHVVVMHPVPKFPGWEPRACAVARWMADTSWCGRSSDRAQIDENRQKAVRAEAEAVLGSSATAIDVYGDLCDAQGCSTLVNDVWLWRDGSHISVAASEMLSSTLRDVITD